MSGDIRVRALGPDDAVAARDLRLESLRLFPRAFGSAWEEEAVQPPRFWIDRLGGPARWLVAEIDGELAGMTVVSLNSRMKLAHNGEIGAFYVRERFHRRGVAIALMQSVMEYLQNRAMYATLTVSADNVAAQKLYARFGFAVCGQLERELNVDGSFIDELMMRKRIF